MFSLSIFMLLLIPQTYSPRGPIDLLIGIYYIGFMIDAHFGILSGIQKRASKV